MNEVTEKAKAKPKEEEKEEDPTDLIELFTKPTDDMDLDELRDAYSKLRQLRKVRIASSKKKNELDVLLERLTPKTAQKFLEKMATQKKTSVDTETETTDES